MRSFAAPLLIIAATAFGYAYTAGLFPSGSGTVAPTPDRVPVVDDWGFAEWAPQTLADDPKRRLLIGYAAEQVAALIETDGKMPDGERRFHDTADVARVWSATLDYATRGAGAVPEQFAQQFQRAADSKMGMTPGGEGAELDDQLRERSVQFFRALSQSLTG